MLISIIWNREIEFNILSTKSFMLEKMYLKTLNFEIIFIDFKCYTFPYVIMNVFIWFNLNFIIYFKALKMRISFEYATLINCQKLGTRNELFCSILGWSIGKCVDYLEPDWRYKKHKHICYWIFLYPIIRNR